MPTSDWKARANHRAASRIIIPIPMTAPPNTDRQLMRVGVNSAAS
jgi:hypothetical protein